MTEPTRSRIVYHSHHFNRDIPTGINPTAPPGAEQPVVLSPLTDLWNIEYDAIAPNVDLFTIGGYPASGVSSLQPPQDVVVLDGGPRAVYWYVVPAGGGAPEGYSTIAWDHDHTLAWTVEEPHNPHSKIVLRTLEEGNRHQWFKLLNA